VQNLPVARGMACFEHAIGKYFNPSDLVQIIITGASKTTHIADL